MFWLLALGYVWVETVGEHGAHHHHDGVAAGAHEPDRAVENFTGEREIVAGYRFE